MMLIKVAWLNVWRHPTRSLVILMSVVFGLWAGLFMLGYVNGIMEERIKTAIEKEVSHLQIHHPVFKTDYDVSYVIPGSGAIMEYVTGMKEVKAVTGRIISKGMLTTAGGSAGIQINGIDPVSEDSVTQIISNVIQGSFIPPNKGRYLLIGEKLLKKLKLKLNSKVVLTLMDKDNTLTSGAFRIKGVYRTRNAPFDESNVFIDRQALAVLTNTPGELNEVAILLKSNEELDAVRQNLRSRFPLVKTESWKEIAPEMELIVSTSGQSVYIFMGIIMLALAFGIINTMLMAVLERTREIGMLMALGMNKIKIFLMILFETLFLVMSGVPFGLLAGFITITWFGHHGINLSVYKELYASFGYSEILYPKLHPADYLTIVELVVITSFLSSLLPARKALSLDPSEAIRK